MTTKELTTRAILAHTIHHGPEPLCIGYTLPRPSELAPDDPVYKVIGTKAVRTTVDGREITAVTIRWEKQ